MRAASLSQVPRRLVARLRAAALPVVALGAVTIAATGLLAAAVQQLGAATRATAGPDQALAGDPVAGKQVWSTSGCGGCHTLSGSNMSFGPNLGQTKPSFDRIVEIVANGFGGMPAFGQLTQQQLEDLAAYVVDRTSQPATLATIRGISVKPSRRVVTVRVRCLAAADGLCAGSVKLRASVRPKLLRKAAVNAKLRTVGLGKVTYMLDAGRRKVVRVPLNDIGRRLAAKLGTKQLRRLPVTVVVSARDQSGLKRVSTKTVRLRAP